MEKVRLYFEGKNCQGLFGLVKRVNQSLGSVSTQRKCRERKPHLMEDEWCLF